MPAKYYGSGGSYAKSGESSRATNYARSPSRRYDREQAKKKKRISAIGQFGAGDLSKADARTTTQSVGEKRQTNFVDLGGGKTGHLADRTEPLFALSEKFAEKASLAGVSVSKAPHAGIGGSIVTPGAQLPEPDYSQIQQQQMQQAGGQEGIQYMQDVVSGKFGRETGMSIGGESQPPSTPVPLISRAISYVLDKVLQADPDDPTKYKLGLTREAAEIAASPLTLAMAQSMVTGKELRSFQTVDSWVTASLQKSARMEKAAKLGTKGVLSKILTTGQNIKHNTKTLRLIDRWMKKKLGKNYKMQMLKGSVATYVLSEWWRYELDTQGVNIAFQQAQTPEDRAAALELQRDINNPNVVEAIARFTPLANFVEPALQSAKLAKIILSTQEQIMKDVEEVGGEVNGSAKTILFEQSFARQQEMKEQASIAAGERFIANSQAVEDIKIEGARIRNEMFLANIQTQEGVKTDEAAKRSADFNKSKLESIEAELEMRKEYKQWLEQQEKDQADYMRDFWLQYRKTVLAMKEDSRGSSLTFGLLG